MKILEINDEMISLLLLIFYYFDCRSISMSININHDQCLEF